MKKRIQEGPAPNGAVIPESSLPYIESSRVLSNISLILSKKGETQFIPFINLYDFFSTKFDKNDFLTCLNDFDFTLGSPTGKHILTILILNKIYLDLNQLFQNVKQEFQRKLKFLINTIDDNPPATKKMSRKLLLMKSDINKECKELFLNFNHQLKAFNDCIGETNDVSKELFYAPLKYLEDYTIGKIFLELSSFLESIILCCYTEEYNNKNYILNEIILLKESIIEGDVFYIYEKFVYLISLISNELKSFNKNFSSAQIQNFEIENIEYIKRFLNQLIKLGELPTEVKKLESKIIDYSIEHKVRISSLLDEEIQKIANSISLQNIIAARLEVRLNDDAYPLSVVYREFIKNLI